MNDDYFVIHKKVLPDYFEKVIKIKEIISLGANISDACKQVGLSRSTFYKYKDYVNRPSMKVGKRVILSLKLVDEPGSLSNILNCSFIYIPPYKKSSSPRTHLSWTVLILRIAAFALEFI